jgi:glycine/serine hydroxymethyltransferase
VLEAQGSVMTNKYAEGYASYPRAVLDCCELIETEYLGLKKRY